ncbi:MAG: SCO family protein [Burkholderiales bacterium]|nr:SCO family protein [Burkholderiales bacterium]
MKSTLIAAALALMLPCVGHAADPHAGHHHAAQPDQPTAAPLVAPPGKPGPQDAATYFTELELQTQDGRPVRFYSDVLQGRTVLINVIYASCKDACPLLTQQLNEVRAHLPADMFGKQVFFVSLTSDPANDTPQALKEFAKKQGADVPGWTFLTGRKDRVDHILKKLGQYSETIEGHSTLFIAGNVPAKRWSKIRPDAAAAAIAERLVTLVGGPPGASLAPAAAARP